VALYFPVVEGMKFFGRYSLRAGKAKMEIWRKWFKTANSR